MAFIPYLDKHTPPGDPSNLVIEPIEVFEDINVEVSEMPVEESAPAAAAPLPADSDYEGCTTEDELNEAVSAHGYVSRIDSAASSNSGQGTATLHPVRGSASGILVTTLITDSLPPTLCS